MTSAHAGSTPLKATLARHCSRLWKPTEGVRFLSIDPGDMDTPLHALAIPDADPTTLRRPEEAAAEIIEAMRAALPRCAIPPAGEPS